MNDHDETFTGAGIPPYTFSYPLFQNWKNNTVTTVSESASAITIAWSGFAEIPPGAPQEMKYAPVPPPTCIYVTKIGRPGYPASGSPMLPYPPKTAKKNPHDIPYEHIDTTDGSQRIVFYLSDFAVEVRYPVMEEDRYDFKIKEFLKSVIASFDIL